MMLAWLAIGACQRDTPADSDATSSDSTMTTTAADTTAGDASTTGTSATRPFRLGFSPWPWDATVAAVDWTWDNLLAHGDVVSMHVEEGVPWPEALAGEPFAQEFRDSVDGQLARVPAGAAILLSVNALDTGRTGLAGYRGADENLPLPPPWDGYTFADADVATAYVNYVERMIEWVQPSWVLIGIESNVLINNDASQWADYASSMCATRAMLVDRGITQPLFVSLFSAPFFPGTTEDSLADQMQVLADLDACVDGFAISAHPFISSLLADEFPADYFTQLRAYSDRWVGVSESSYPAQVWSSAGLTWNGSPGKQDEFLRVLLGAAAEQRFEFVVWFAIRDYDQLWAGVLAEDPLALVWRDTGLFDEDGVPRVALTRWDAELDKPWAMD